MKPVPFTPEEQLLLLTARLVLDTTQEAQLDGLLTAPMRWDWLLEQAKRLGSQPLLHYHLARPGRQEHVPPEVLAVLDRAYRLTVIKNLQIYGSLRRVLTALAEADVPVILLKGAFQAQWVYGDIGLRPMSDLDFLCRKEDEEKIWRVLDELGAGVDTDGEKQDIDHFPPGVREHINHPPPRYLGKIVRIEVHFHLFGNRCADPLHVENDLWARSIEHDWDGLSVRSLAWEHQLLHLASHLQFHLPGGTVFLYWLADLHELLRQRRATLDWEGFCRMAGELGVERECQEVFGILGEPWPNAGPGFPSSLTLREILTPGRASAQRRFADYMGLIRAARYSGGFRECLRYITWLVVPSKARMAQRHPEAGALALAGCYFLDPLIRIGIVLRGAGAHVRRSLRG